MAIMAKMVKFINVFEVKIYKFRNIKNTSLAAKGALANRLQRRTACKIQNSRQGPQNGRGGLERCLPLGFWAFPSTFGK